MQREKLQVDVITGRGQKYRAICESPGVAARVRIYYVAPGPWGYGEKPRLLRYAFLDGYPRGHLAGDSSRLQGRAQDPLNPVHIPWGMLEKALEKELSPNRE